MEKNSASKNTFRQLRQALMTTADRLQDAGHSLGDQPFGRRSLLQPTFWALRLLLNFTAQLVSLPAYFRRNSTANFATYARRDGDTYIDSYSRFVRTTRWAIGVTIVTIIAAAAALFSAGIVRLHITANAPKIVYHVGILKRTNALKPIVDSFKQELTKKGFHEGANIVYEDQTVMESDAALDPYAVGFVRDHKDLIVAVGDAAAAAVKTATVKTPIPTVFYSNFDPVGDRLIASYSRSGNNLVGMGNGALIDRQIDILQTLIPDLQTIGVMSIPTDTTNQNFIRALTKSAAAQGLKVRTETVKIPEDIPTAFTAMASQGIKAAYFAPSLLTATRLELVAQEAIKNKIALISNSAANAAAGTLVALLVDQTSAGQDLASLADQLLRGTPPGNISSMYASQSYLALNQKTAAAIGIVLPPDLIKRADVLY